MISPGEKKESIYILAAVLAVTGLVTGCADTGSNHPNQQATVDEPRAVVGDSPKDRAAIESANQQIYNMEHVASPDPSTITTVPPSPEITYGAVPAATPDSSTPPSTATGPTPDTSTTPTASPGSSPTPTPTGGSDTSSAPATTAPQPSGTNSQ